MSVLTCHTPGCVNDGVPIELQGADIDGNPAPVEAAFCGGCGQPILDIVEAPPEGS